MCKVNHERNRNEMITKEEENSFWLYHINNCNKTLENLCIQAEKENKMEAAQHKTREVITKMFLDGLEAMKSCKVNSNEWNAMWRIIEEAKCYLEDHVEDEDE